MSREKGKRTKGEKKNIWNSPQQMKNKESIILGEKKKKDKKKEKRKKEKKITRFPP